MQSVQMADDSGVDADSLRDVIITHWLRKFFNETELSLSHDTSGIAGSFASVFCVAYHWAWM